MPRPLPAHLASATLFWLSSRAGLTGLSSGSPPWSSSAALKGLAEEIRAAGPDAVAEALDRQLVERAERFLTGLETYRRHAYRRAEQNAPVLWREGGTRLVDYGAGDGQAVMIVPSLINRYHIVDLLPERSFACFLAAAGLRPLVVDWGEPGAIEQGFGLGDYIARLDRAVEVALTASERRVAVLGYCMGGLLALAAAVRRPDGIAALALLATPWDFHAERPEQARLLAAMIEAYLRWSGPKESLPLSVIQGLFLSLDPLLGERKFIRFAGLDPAGAAAREFVALEDWINDGVPLAHDVAAECASGWYRDNAPTRRAWTVGGSVIDPRDFARPSLVVVPHRDRIVPPRSALVLADALPRAETMRPPLGHIGMMASANAPDRVWRPLAEWLVARLA